jgi:hypothetical protein
VDVPDALEEMVMDLPHGRAGPHKSLAPDQALFFAFF